MKLLAFVAMATVLAGCGDGGSGRSAGSANKNEVAASACDAYAKGQLDEKTYRLDHATLAASMTDAGDGSNFLHGPIVINPGLSSESKQSLECTVRWVAGKDQPDVLKMQFIW